MRQTFLLLKAVEYGSVSSSELTEPTRKSIDGDHLEELFAMLASCPIHCQACNRQVIVEPLNGYKMVSCSEHLHIGSGLLTTILIVIV